MIIDSFQRIEIDSEEEWDNLIAETKQLININEITDETYFEIANSYSLPIHLAYLIIRNIVKGKSLKLSNLSSVSFYAICRDVLVPYKNKAFTFRKLFRLNYPYLKNTDKRLEWYLKHNNGLSITQKIQILEGETSFNSMGVGRTRFEQALRRNKLELTHEEVERRRLNVTDGEWAAAIATFVDQEKGDLTAAELLLTADALAEDTKITIKMVVLSYLLSRLGKLEIYFIANHVNRFHDHVSRTSSLVRAFANVYHVDQKTLERLVSMHSMVDVAWMVEHDKILEQFERLIPFRMFKPMLASKWERQYNFPVYAEAKYDGVRLLVHKLGNKVTCTSRRRRDYTYKFPVITQLSSKIPAYSTILDGEITAQQWTIEGPRYLNVFELHESVKHGINNFVLIYVVFDVLYLNGVELISYPFSKRREIRHQLLETMRLSLKIAGLEVREVESIEIKTKPQLINVYNKFIDSGYEGAIVKDPKGTYELGKRSNFWYKLKPKETLDVTITGIIPLQERGALRVWGIRYAVKSDTGFINMGMIRGLDARAGIRLAELLALNDSINTNTQLLDLSAEIESHGIYSQQKESLGFEIEPQIVITIDSLGILRRGDKFKLRNARFLYIREDMPVDDISSYGDVYEYYMRAQT